MKPGYVVVSFDELYRPDLRPVDVAAAIVAASEQGKRPVDFRLRSSFEYWSEWTHVGEKDCCFMQPSTI